MNKSEITPNEQKRGYIISVGQGGPAYEHENRMQIKFITEHGETPTTYYVDLNKDHSDRHNKIFEIAMSAYKSHKKVLIDIIEDNRLYSISFYEPFLSVPEENHPNSSYYEITGKIIQISNSFWGDEYYDHLVVTILEEKTNEKRDMYIKYNENQFQMVFKMATLAYSFNNTCTFRGYDSKGWFWLYGIRMFSN